MQIVVVDKTYEVTVVHVRRESGEHAPRGATLEVRSPDGWNETVEHVETKDGFRFFLDAASEHRDQVREVVDRLPPLAPTYELV